MPALDLSDFSEDQLSDLIADATSRRTELRESRQRESVPGRYGSNGQDVRDPGHGVIPVPTPNEVEDVGPAHGVEDAARQTRV